MTGSLNLGRYGFNVILPVELTAIDYRNLYGDNIEVTMHCPIGQALNTFTIKFDSLERCDEFMGLVTGERMNFNMEKVKASTKPIPVEPAKIEIPKPNILNSKGR